MSKESDEQKAKERSDALKLGEKLGNVPIAHYREALEEIEQLQIRIGTMQATIDHLNPWLK